MVHAHSTRFAHDKCVHNCKSCAGNKSVFHGWLNSANMQISCKRGKSVKNPVQTFWFFYVKAYLHAFIQQIFAIKNDFIFRMPEPYVPFLDSQLLSDVFPDAVGISVISYVITLSISRILGNRHKYEVWESTHFNIN